MQSPFPGMDPYLEEPGGWKGVHGRLIAILGELLNRDLGPSFIADGDTRVYVVAPSERQWIFPDLYVIETPRPQTTPVMRGAVATPVRVSLSEPTAMEQPYIVIRDRTSRQVVTIVDVLSPINKTPTALTGAISAARAEFLHKRRATMASRHIGWKLIYCELGSGRLRCATLILAPTMPRGSGWAYPIWRCGRLVCALPCPRSSCRCHRPGRR